MDNNDTVMMLDEAIALLDRAHYVLGHIGRESDDVQQARFDRCVESIGNIANEVLSVMEDMTEEIVMERSGHYQRVVGCQRHEKVAQMLPHLQREWQETMSGIGKRDR